MVSRTLSWPPPEDIQTVDELKAYLEAAEACFRKLDTPKLGGPRRHHYIPQFYLKLFAQNRKRLIRIPIPVPLAASRKATNITNLAVMKDFYTAHTAKGESALIENMLAVWDGDASECIKKLTDRDAWPLAPGLKLRMGFWIALLTARSPQWRRGGEAMLDFGGALLGDAVGDEASVAEPARRRFHRNVQLQWMLQTPGELIQYFADRHWQVLHFNSEDGLLLSDTGYAMTSSPDSYLGTGVANASEILFPLGRHHLLCMHLFDGVDEQVVECDYGTSTYMVRHYNNVFATSTYQEIFCHPNDYNHVLPLAKQCPNLPLMNIYGGNSENLIVDGINAPPQRRGPRRYRASNAEENHTEPGSGQVAGEA